VDDLPDLDPQMYQSLMMIKNHKGDVKDLDLTFITDTNLLGVSEETELIPNGRQIIVDNSNRIRYIHLVADHKLNIQTRKQTSAFVQGLADVIPLEFLKLFSVSELRQLVHGDQHIDLVDLKQHTAMNEVMSGSPCAQWVWEILDEFNESQRSEFIRFVTSSDRAPLGGFGQLKPSFAIMASNSGDERLPTASTCVNMLKITLYSSKEIMKEKLLYAIGSASGFMLQ